MHTEEAIGYGSQAFEEYWGAQKGIGEDGCSGCNNHGLTYILIILIDTHCKENDQARSASFATNCLLSKRVHSVRVDKNASIQTDRLPLQ